MRQAAVTNDSNTTIKGLQQNPLPQPLTIDAHLTTRLIVTVKRRILRHSFRVAPSGWYQETPPSDLPERE